MDDSTKLNSDLSNDTQNFTDFSVSGRFQEIDINEINFQEAIGKGSFGVVHRALWQNITVAVKKVETDAELSALQNEIEQLSRIQHENIINMYGVAISLSSKCLVMEYADGGSLYEFLHRKPHHRYNISHALSWLLQCARAIDYLHSYQPKPIIHRDLKPLNMLLTNGKRQLKICDFGTACVLRSTMTDNRGSIAWMAPEVMTCHSYDQKCDVYSWGMILWEVLTRRIPFEELGNPMRIMWKVAKKVRPPLIQGCPRPLENLITSCWSDENDLRPSMQQVLEIMTPLYKILSNGDDPGIYSSSSSGDSYAEFSTSGGNDGSSGDHTSRDVSELPSTNNTMDLPYNRNSLSPDNAHSTPVCLHKESYSESLKFPQTQQEYPFSKSPVMDATPRIFHVGTNFHPSSLVTPQNFAVLPPNWPLYEPHYSPSNPFNPNFMNNKRKETNNCTSHNISKEFSKLKCENEMKKDSSVFTPLSIVIPNSDLRERNDIIIANSVDLHPMRQIPSVDKSPNAHPSNNNLALKSSPNTLSKKTSPESTSRRPLILPTSIDIKGVSTDSIDSLSSNVLGNVFGHYNDTPLRGHLHPDQSSMFRRRSAEIPQNVSHSKREGHKRSSSYGSSTMIGFEPLAGEMSDWKALPESICQQQMVSPIHDNASIHLSPGFQYGEGNISVGVEANCTNHPSKTPPAPSSLPHMCPTSESTTVGGVFSYRPSCSDKQDHLPSHKGELGPYFNFLENDLKPVMPVATAYSQQIFQEHEELAHKYLVVQENIVFLQKSKNDLIAQHAKQDKNHKDCQLRYTGKINQLQKKNESFKKNYHLLTKQLADLKKKLQVTQDRPSSFSVASTSLPPCTNPQTSPHNDNPHSNVSRYMHQQCHPHPRDANNLPAVQRYPNSSPSWYDGQPRPQLHPNVYHNVHPH